MINLTVEKRDIVTNLSGLRTKGFIPAVFYGHKQASTPISIKEVDFLKAYKQAGESSVIHLTGNDIDHEVLIQDIDLDPVTDNVRHADFYVIEKGKKDPIAGRVFGPIPRELAELGFKKIVSLAPEIV